ncbi:MAG: ATPase domain-containing protein [Promethearchaeota archaeon]
MKNYPEKNRLKPLDELDKKIINCLEKDPRMAIKKIAETVQASRVTVSKRIKRLRSQNVLRLFFMNKEKYQPVRKKLQIERIQTHINNFDSYIGGGFPKGSMTVLVGKIGTGTSTFCQNFVWNALNEGYRCFYFSLFRLEHEVRQQMLSFGWDVAKFEKKRQLFIKDSSNFIPPPDEMFEILLDEKKTFQAIWDSHKQLNELSYRYFNKKYPDIVIIDSLEKISNYMSFKYWQVFWDLVIQFGKSLNMTGIGVFHPETVDSKIVAASKSVSDALFLLEKELSKNKIERTIIIERFPFTDHFTGKISFKITSSGIKIV